ncbi:MAG: helix-turn-helix transcriptional regulator [Treponema sp.]|jgi:transcriptional regulator with XRE-family HTH domain|nr:helix-turn-helix transcriptional regulator [Treponema sp.]
MNERELLGIFSTNIKRLRARMKWSQAELAEKIDISINFLSDIETGKKWASPITMVKFANVFSIEVYELLKPLNVLPDNYSNIIDKYTEDIYEAIEEVRKIYLLKMKT